MGDTGQIYSVAPRPGCQRVLEVNACVGFSSILPKDYGKEKNSGNLAGTQARYGQYLQDLCRTIPLHLCKSSPVEAYTDYGCLETQGKQWACISGLPAMGAMAIERGG
ncbi:hypothetical protein HO173_008083 [Letharia columbiana]|uniref:Uncharacterized protein n=1 Tax=Letharia columbiana TaxID=112416 RepID=A0A8H6FSH8_9LECA|nr:uncharacterized protein HO173_008083 [Letharia columbiana]KAF6233871.1 hypothetical protein HO173_008083 [Letharia columbiana]